MKTGIIIVTYHTSAAEINRLNDEIASLDWPELRPFFIDNSSNGHGFAYGVNIGLRKAISSGCQLFIIANPDISISGMTKEGALKAGNHFDIWGFGMRQQGRVYYGGEIDRWRMSGGLIKKRPQSRFTKTDFVTGSLMVISKKAVELNGFFDESFGMYYEDVDYCYRAKQKGLRIGIDASLIYEHFELSQGNKQKDIYLFMNRLRFFWRYASVKQKIREVLRLPKTIGELIIQFTR